MKKTSYTMRSKIVPYPGMGGWHFLVLPKVQSETIQKNFSQAKRGWGSLPVSVTLGKTVWKTSIFPDKKSGTYLLPIKSEVRRKEDVRAGETVSFTITLMA